nr:immunoglobulin heavy chain junction region [Macaca mulatta]MOW98457.1 immunoglobulin heavy chain junction region [Macaca mulatta]MOW99262.1 immunoglobulin heavy chain junction region [Macaca mulatta]MOW99359.1 immunoglobulin heavy chain junction region [Macaca mulatta]MOW99404.1 immunoglobulin heavy chain junction region [Macaca mulatta]
CARGLYFGSNYYRSNRFDVW